MKKTSIRTLIVVGTIGLTFGIGWAAEQVAPEKEIILEGPRPVHFNHKTHLKLGVTCGECHHDAEHQSLSAEKIGEMSATAQLKCANCHNKDFQKEELRTDRDVFHTNCRDCHREGIDGKKGPMACGSCHVRKQRIGQRQRAIEGC